MVSNSQIILDAVLEQRRKETYPDSKPSDFFEFFTAQQALKEFDLSYDEIESGLVGNGGDGGIDAIYLIANGDLVHEDSDLTHLKKEIVVDVVIVQSKTTASFSELAVDRFISVSHDLFDLSSVSPGGKGYHNDLVAAMQRFQFVYRTLAPAFPTLNVSFYYASKGGNLHPNLQHKVDILRNVVVSHLPSAKFDFKFLGASELLELAGQRPHTTYKLPLAETPISSADQIGFVCLVKLSDFYDFITDENGSLHRQLFEANVRDYQGRTQVNDDIQTTLESDGNEDFWWLNNGISILATQASQGGKALTIKDPQIVNGLQTSTEVYNYYNGRHETQDDRNILVRVMVPTEDESRDRIIKATNSQTVVPPSSLRATDRIHRNIEEYLLQMGLFYDRRKNYYKNEGKPRSRIVSIPYLAQAVLAILLKQPDQARARPSSLLKREDDYHRIFNLSYPINAYYVCVEAMRRVETLIKSPELNVPSEHRNNLRFYVAMCAVAGIGNAGLECADQIATFDLAGLDKVTVQRSVDYILPKYLALGGNDQVAKGTELLQNVLNGSST